LKAPFSRKEVISDTYLLIILLIWLLKTAYLSNTYFYEHYIRPTVTRSGARTMHGFGAEVLNLLCEDNMKAYCFHRNEKFG